MPEVNWNADEICLKDYHVAQLPDSPICPSLVKLSSKARRLRVFPPNFFENMHSLKVLDLSHSGIISLTPSITGLRLLEELVLRDCHSMTEMPTEIGMLTKLKVLDMEGTEIMCIPKQLRKLGELEVLRVSLSQYANLYIKNIKKSASDAVIPRNVISKLKKLKELCITLLPQYIQEELCHLENLETLRWHLPTSESLHQFLLLERDDRSPVYQNISNLTLTVGQQYAYTISLLPRGIEEMFEKSFKNCLKWIDAKGSMDDISKLIATRVEALFLLRHSTIENLSKTFDVTRLKYCLLAGCKEMKSIVELSTDRDDVGSGEKGGGLESLEYLSVHYMNNLQRVWKGPIAEGSLSKLTVMALHNCQELSMIFTLTMVQNLSCLIELTVEDCPKVRSLITTDQSHNIKGGGPILPSLERIYIAYLPEMDTLFGCGYIVEKLGTLFVYACEKLRSLDASEVPQIKKIEGEIEWWEVLDCDHKSRWEDDDIFVPLGEDAIHELHDDGHSLQRFCDNSLSHGGLDQELSNIVEDPAAKGWVLEPDEDREISLVMRDLVMMTSTGKLEEVPPEGTSSCNADETTHGGVEEGSNSDDGPGGQGNSTCLEEMFSKKAAAGPKAETRSVGYKQMEETQRSWEIIDRRERARLARQKMARLERAWLSIVSDQGKVR